MGANTKLAAMPDKLPNINSNNRGFHGFNNQLQPPSGSKISIDQVEINFEKRRKAESVLPLPGINNCGILANQSHSRCVDDDDDEDSTVEGVSRLASHDEQICTLCAEKLALETQSLQDVITELQLEKDRQKQEFDTTKRKLDNTSKELKTSQAMITTLKDQNKEKADKIAKLTREATIGLWNREKKKLLQFADVREASLECELKSLQHTSRDFKDRSLDRIGFLHDQVARLKLQLNVRSSNKQMNKMLEIAEKRLATTKEELEKQKEEFFAFRRDMVGMLAGFNRDFTFLQNQVDPNSQQVGLDYFPSAEQFESMLEELHKAAVSDNLSEVVGKLPEKFKLSEAQKNEMSNMRREKASLERANDISIPQDPDSLSEADILKKLENIENALNESSREIEEYDENMTDINDSGISLNDYEGRSTRSSRDTTHDMSRDMSRDLSRDIYAGSHDNQRGDKTVRFENTRGDQQQNKRNNKSKTSEKCVQTELQDSEELPNNNRSPVPSRRGKRNRKSRSREKPHSREKPITPRKKSPKKIDPTSRLKQEQKFQKQWLDTQQNVDKPNSKPQKRGSPDSKSKSHQNNMTFTHLREMYSEKRVHNLIDRTTGAVDVELAASQFTSLSRAGILEGFTHFVQYDSNNDYRLDMDEVVRAISRATDEVVESEEIKAALFELGVLETDELDFFDFLCIQETLATGTFDKSKSNVLRSQVLNMNKNSSVSKYCAVM